MFETVNSSLIPASKPKMPTCVIDRLKQFMLDKKTGNVTLNIKEGKILGFHILEIVPIE